MVLSKFLSETLVRVQTEKQILSHPDNALVYTRAVSMAKIMEINFELLQHPPYSPGLVSSDFFYFQT